MLRMIIVFTIVWCAVWSIYLLGRILWVSRRAKSLPLPMPRSGQPNELSGSQSARLVIKEPIYAFSFVRATSNNPMIAGPGKMPNPLSRVSVEVELNFRSDLESHEQTPPPPLPTNRMRSSTRHHPMKYVIQPQVRHARALATLH
jgi:hypothetical protein